MKLGNCFESALTSLLDKSQDIHKINARNFFLVHGIAKITVGPLSGEEFCHAWVEFDCNGFEFCYDAETKSLSTKATYYAIGRVKTVRRYSIKEALEKSMKYTHYGPWEMDLVLCEIGKNPSMDKAVEGIHYN
jgi:hypothetical protein